MFCPKCGAENENSATFCVKCGEKLTEEVKAEVVSKDSTMKMIAFIFAIISCISTGWCLIPLCWTIPMTIKIYKAYKGEITLSTGFKVCTLIFVSIISGILLLVDED